jgi:hypothetical protein
MAKKSQSKTDQALDALMTGKELTEAHRKSLRAVGESLIDQFMSSVGYGNPAERTDENGWRHLQLESAEGIAGITENEGELYLHVEAIVMPLPSDKDLVQPLMREALEFNCTLPGACRIAIRGTHLIAAATENMRSLRKPEDYGHLVHLVMALANAIDDRLKERFGGTTKVRPHASVA